MDSRLSDLLRTLREIERRVRQLSGLSTDDRTIAERVSKLLREAGDVLADPGVKPRTTAVAPPGKCPWYVTAAAVREFLALGFMEDNPDNFETSETQLMSICEHQARLAKDDGLRQIWRTPTLRFLNRKDATRLELTVSMSERSEGELPQLVRVRAKGANSWNRPKLENQ